MADSAAQSAIERGYGWKPDPPDQRDRLYAAPPPVQEALPAQLDLTSQCPPVYDQGRLGSCTANGIAGAMEFDAMKQGIYGYSTPSRLFIYYNERELEGTVDTDSGAYIRDGVKSVTKQGACFETDWPYDTPKFAAKPSSDCYQKALDHQTLEYSRVARDLTQMKGCLAEGYPFVFGFTVYESLESPEVDASGIVPMPLHTEKVLGGHCVLAVGYDDALARFRIRNSWSTKWGDKGYGTMPYAYLLSRGLASDFWTIRRVE
jgi:C1A family cysteine protease